MELYHQNNSFFSSEFPQPLDILFLGDSHCERFKNSGLSSLEDCLKNKKMATFGMPGANLGDTIEIVKNIPDNSIKPNHIMIQCGVNDFRNHEEPIKIIKNIDALILQIKNKFIKPKIHWFLIFPKLTSENPKENQLISRLNFQIKSKIENMDKNIVVHNIKNLLLGPSGNLDPNNYQDTIHLSKTGYHIWVNYISVIIKP